MPAPYCGLDFGTSNSTFAVAAAEGAPRLLPLEDGKPTIPSVLFFSFEDDRTYFGRKALSEYITGADGRVMRSIKSVLGTALFADRTRIKKHAVSFADILGTFIAHLRAEADAALGQQIDSVVVGRPVQFVDDDPAADAEAQAQLEAAVRAQGYRHIAFQYEPIAAALDYEQQVAGEELALVVDIGGGTSDFTVIRLSPERARASDRAADILAAAGVHVGGTDFDRLLSLYRAMPLLGYQTPTRDGKRVLPSAPYYDLATWHRINRLYNAQSLAELRSTRNEARDPDKVELMIDLVRHRLGHALAAAVEDTKIALTHAETAQLAFSSHDIEVARPITRDDLAHALDAAIARIIATVDRTLALAGTPSSAIDTIMMTGGSTQIPAIIARLRARFPEARFVATDAFGSVGLGLALDARRKF